MINVPLSALPNQELLMFLDRQNCTINVYQRGARLYLDLFLNMEPIQRGAIILPKAPIITRVSHGFKGQFRMIDLKSKPDKPQIPNYRELGTKFYLFYLSETEEQSGAKY